MKRSIFVFVVLKQKKKIHFFLDRHLTSFSLIFLVIYFFTFLSFETKFLVNWLTFAVQSAPFSIRTLIVWYVCTTSFLCVSQATCKGVYPLLFFLFMSKIGDRFGCFSLTSLRKTSTWVSPCLARQWRRVFPPSYF